MPVYTTWRYLNFGLHFCEKEEKKKEKTDEVVMQDQCEKNFFGYTEHSLSECGYCMHALRAYLHTHSTGPCLTDDLQPYD